MKYLFLACLMYAGNLLYAQNRSVKIRVIDAENQTPITGAEVKPKHPKKSLAEYSDKQGYANIVADSVEIILPGYNSVSILATENMIVRLQPVQNFLSEVVVSASREEQKRREIPVAIGKLNSATIRETKATALYQLLNKSAGVYMVNLGNEQHTMAIRQPITYNALYLYLEDGLPIRPTGIFNHNALYEINMNSLKSIEVVKGPASSLYGSNAIGGSVNFISGSAPAGSSSNISVQGDNYNYYRTDVSTGFSKGKFGLIANGYASRQKNSWQDYTDFDKYSANLRGSYELNQASRLTVSASYNYLNTQTPGSLDSARFYNRSYESNQRFTYRKVKAFRANARLDYQWNKNNSTFFTAFFRDNSTAQLPSYKIGNIPNAPTRSTGQENEMSFNSYGLLAQHKAHFNFLNSQLIGGVYLDYSPSSYYAEFLQVARDPSRNFYTSYAHTDSLVDDYKLNLFNSAAFMQYQLKPTTNLTVVAGLRYDNLIYNFSNKLPANRTVYKQEERNEYNILAPKLGATYNLGKGYGAYVNFSTGFQPPETSSLYSSTQANRLKQATFQNYELGGWLPFTAKLNLELSLFEMLGENEIISIVMPDNTTQNENAGATKHVGIEYTLHYTPLQQLAFRLSGTFAKHTYTDYSEVVAGTNRVYDGNRMMNAPTSIINSEITWKPTFVKGFRSALEWQYVSSYFVNSANTQSYKGYNIYNLRLGYDFNTTKIRGAGIWLNVLNLTDKLYATTTTYSTRGITYTAAPPRTVSLGVSYAMSKLK